MEKNIHQRQSNDCFYIISLQKRYLNQIIQTLRTKLQRQNNQYKLNNDIKNEIIEFRIFIQTYNDLCLQNLNFQIKLVNWYKKKLKRNKTHIYKQKEQYVSEESYPLQTYFQANLNQLIDKNTFIKNIILNYLHQIKKKNNQNQKKQDQLTKHQEDKVSTLKQYTQKEFFYKKGIINEQQKARISNSGKTQQIIKSNIIKQQQISTLSFYQHPKPPIKVKKEFKAPIIFTKQQNVICQSIININDNIPDFFEANFLFPKCNNNQKLKDIKQIIFNKAQQKILTNLIDQVQKKSLYRIRKQQSIDYGATYEVTKQNNCFQNRSKQINQKIIQDQAIQKQYACHSFSIN